MVKKSKQAEMYEIKIECFSPHPLSPFPILLDFQRYKLCEGKRVCVCMCVWEKGVGGRERVLLLSYF